MDASERGPRRPGTADRAAVRQSADERLPAENRVPRLAHHVGIKAMPPDPDALDQRPGNRPRITAPAKLTPLLTVADVADHLKVATRTVRRALKKGEMHFHYVGRQIRIPQHEVAAFLVRRWR